MNKILKNFDSAANGESKSTKADKSEMKTILESFHGVAENTDTQINEAVSITVSGDSANEIAQLVGLMGNSAPAPAAPTGSCGEPAAAPASMPPMITPKMMDDIESSEETVAEDDWDNAPDEEYSDHQKMTHDLSGGINRRKNSYKRAEPGDNPMAVESSLREELASMLRQKMSEKKGFKPDFLDLDGDGDTEEPMKKAAKDAKKKDTKKKTSESVNTGLAEETVYIDYLNKEKGFKPDRITFTGDTAYEDAVEWAQQNLGKFNPDMIKFESQAAESEHTDSATVNVSVRDAGQANEIARDLFRGEYENDGSDNFVFKDSTIAEEFKNELRKQGLEVSEASVSEKTTRQLKDPKTEVMVVKNGKVKVINKKDQDKYMKQGYGLAEAAPKNNPVAKHSGINKAQVHKDKKRAEKQGDVKHKKDSVPMEGLAEAGNIVDVEKDVSESTPVFNRYVKPFLDAAPEKIIEFYDKEAKNIIGRLTEERASLAEAKADTKLHDAVISKLQENFRTITESQALEVGDVEFVSPRQWRRRSDLSNQFPQGGITSEFENFEGIAKVESESGALLEFAFLFDIDGTEEASKIFTIYSGDLKLSKTQDPAELEGIASDLGLPAQAAANPATFESLLYRSIGGQEKIRSMIERYLEENYADAAIELYQRESGRD